MKRKLRVGLLLKSYQAPAWLYCSIEKIVESYYAEVAIVVINEGDYGNISRLRRLRKKIEFMAYTLFRKTEEKIFQCRPNALESKNMRILLKSVFSLKVRPKQNKGLHYLAKSDIQNIKNFDLDILIEGGFGDLGGDILTASQFGVWAYQHSDIRMRRGGPPGFWEVILKSPTTGITLNMLDQHGNDASVLARLTTRTERVLIHWNNNKCYWKAISLLPRRLKDLYELGEEEFFSRVRENNQHPAIYSGRFYQTPGNAELIALLLKHYYKYLISKIRSVFYCEQWVLLFRIDPAKEYASEFYKFSELCPPKDRFWADPTTIYANGKYYVFFEEFVYRLKKGHISYLIMDSEGDYSESKKVLELPYHLSYPFVFMHDHEYYMIPETRSNQTIDLYRSLSFPDNWEKVMTLMEGVIAVDTTLLLKDGMWWLFANMCENEGASVDEELFLYYASDFMTQDWTPHPLNPIVSDVRTARPAGKIFTRNGKMYRPAQNCSRRYGYGMAINQIITLTTTDYEEICVNEIGPDWDESIVATHTVNHDNKMTIIDAIKRRRRLFG